MSLEAKQKITNLDHAMGTGSHALHIALQTMNERCQQLQQRLTLVEDENIKLRVQLSSDQHLRTDSEQEKTSETVLQEKLAELTRQKSQLTHHICMVATENRHLWSRLSKLTKDNHLMGDQLTKINDTLSQHDVSPKPSPHNINRSKTFTQNTPNAKLRNKVDSDSDVSLEEISLKLINNLLQEKNELEQQYEQMVELQATDEPHIESGNIGFSYMSDVDDDLMPAITQCIEQFDLIKKDVQKQNNDLNVILQHVNSNRNDEKSCKKCKEYLGNSNISSKDINTSTKLEIASPAMSTSQNETNKTVKVLLPNNHNTFVPISKEADDIADDLNYDKNELDKFVERSCPMCGKLFYTSIFTEFLQHVDEHFKAVDADDDEFIMEANYDIVTHSVGNF